MKTETVFYNYPFSKVPENYSANIIETRTVNGNTALILDKTIFYPEGGGQPADRGTINGIPVADVKEEAGEILHIIKNSDLKNTSGEITMPAGEAVLKLDTIRRRDISVQHSAQHLLSAAILRHAGFHTVSIHLGDRFNTIDANGPSMDSSMIFTIEDSVAAAIEEDRPFNVHLCPPERAEDFTLRKPPPKGEEQLRIIEIENYDCSACCGTHVSSTGQIGMIRILGAEKYKGMIRMTFIAGRRCLEESRMLWSNAVQISQTLSVPVEETGKAAAGLLEKSKKLEETVKLFREEAAKTASEELGLKIKDRAFYAESFPGRDMEELLRIGKNIQKITDAVIALGSEKELKITGMCSAKGADIRGLFRAALEKTGGKGGGGPSFFQGQFNSAGQYRSFFAELEKMQGNL